MSGSSNARVFLVLASRRAFEAFVGPVPARFESCFRFLKPNRGVRIEALLPSCRIVISKSYLPPGVNRWIFAARRLGIPTLLLVDGPLEWSNQFRSPSLSRHMGPRQSGLFEPIIHDGVAGIGAAQNRWIAHQNADRGIELMSYSNRRIRTAREGSTASPDDESYELDFLVTTARTPYFDESEKHDLAGRLIELCEVLTRERYRFALRLFDPPLIRAIREVLPDVPVDAAGGFADVLARTRCVIGTPSSVLLEAMEHDKPTGTLMFRDSPLFYQTGWLLGCTSDWGASLGSMHARDPKRMDLQRLVLRENLSETDFFAACDRIREGEILTDARPLDAEDLEFENRMLHRLLGWRASLLTPFLRRFRAKDD